MLVICKQCRKLVAEEQAVRMSEEEFNILKLDKLDLKWGSWYVDNPPRHIQICVKCYHKPKWYTEKKG